MKKAYNKDKPNLKEISDSLQENQEIFHLLVESIRDCAIFMTDAEGYIISWNKGAERIKGYTSNEILGKHISIFYTKEEIEKEKPWTNLKRAAENGHYESEGWRVRKDGTLFWADVVFTALLDEQGNLKGFAKITRDISKQKKIENEIAHLNETLEKRVIERTKELQISEKKFHDLFQNNPMAMWVIDAISSKILDVNEAAIRHYGYSRKEFLSMSSLDIRPEGDKERYLQLSQTSKPLVNYYTGLWKHLKKDGTIITVEVSADDILFEGKSARIILSNDVTEKIKIEENLQKTLKEVSDYKYALDESSIVAITDQKGIIRYVNDNFCKISKYSAEELIGQDHYIINSGYHPKEYIRNLWVTIANGKIWRGELKNKAKDGSYYWVDTTIVPFLNEEGKPYQYVAIRSDITERKLAEEKILLLNEEIARNEKRFRGLIENSHDIVALLNPNVNPSYVYRSPSSYKITGWTDEEIATTGTLELVHPDDISLIKDFIASVFSNPGKSMPVTYRSKHKQGHYIWLEGVMTNMMHDESINGIVINLRDVTEKKEAEAKLLLLNEELEDRVQQRTAQLELANKELEAFSYSVSHDLRAPLRAVNGYAKILEEDYFNVFDAEGKRLLKTVQDNAKKMGILIDDLLAFSRLGRKEVYKSLINMTDLTQNVIFELERDETDKPEIILNELHPVLADHSLMTQVMTNLLSNAIKYSSKKEKPVIKISSEKKGNDIVYLVSDNGTGFNMQYAHKLFGVFQRLHGEDFEGTGVGLAIVQRIIERHNGKIWAEAEPEKGATFYFSLPDFEITNQNRK